MQVSIKDFEGLKHTETILRTGKYVINAVTHYDTGKTVFAVHEVENGCRIRGSIYTTQTLGKALEVAENLQAMTKYSK